MVILYRIGVAAVALSLLACGDTAGSDIGSTDGPDVFRLEDGGQVIMPNDEDAGARTAEQPTPVRVETRLQYAVTRAGEPNQVSCDVYDAAGRLLADLSPAISVSPENRIRRDGLKVTAESAGEYQVACVVPLFDLVDQTPSQWVVRAAAPFAVTAQVMPERVQAGMPFDVQCLVEDEFGNAISDSVAEIEFQPMPARLETSGDRQYRVEDAGRYDVFCVVEDAAQSSGAPLVVGPASIQSLSLGLLPQRDFYGVGEIVDLDIIATDVYGNQVEDLDFDLAVEPNLTRLGARRLSLERPGMFRVTVTANNGALVATADIIVDEGGPGITCLEPVFGRQLVAGPGDRIALRGRVQDTAGVRSVRVDGAAVELDQNGEFSTTIQVAWGVNVAEVAATDVTGATSSTLCGFVASEIYHSPDEDISDTVRLRLAQASIDDGDTVEPYDSLGDILRVALNSDELVTWFNQTVRALNPIVPNECRVRLPLLGTCIFSAGLNFESLALDGPNSVTLTLIEGGGRLGLELRDIAADGRLTGTLTNVGVVTSDFVRADADFAIRLDGQGQMRVDFVRIFNVEVGEIDSDFDGFVTGAALEALVGLADTFFRDSIVAQVTTLIETQARRSLADFFGGFDMADFDAEFEIPALGGGDPTQLRFGTRFSRVDFSPERALFGIALRVDGEEAPGHVAEGVVIPRGVPTDPSVGPDASASVDVLLLNLVMHQLWRSGYFEDQAADLVSLFTGGFPGFEVSLQLPSAPFAEGTDDSGVIRLFLGPLYGEVAAPVLGPEPMGFRAAAEVDVGVGIQNGTTLRFDPVTISALTVSVDGASLDEAAREQLDRVLMELIQGFIQDTLSASLPALPIPQFSVPDSLVQFGVPADLRFGVVEAQLGTDVRTLRVSGRFGVVPDEMERPDEPEPEMNGQLCTNTCRFAADGDCDDGGPQSDFALCELGTDCDDCGPREP